MKGSEFLKLVWDMSDPKRDALALSTMLAGNTPEFMEHLQTCRTSAVIDGGDYELTYLTPPDYLSIGTNEDFVRWPLIQPSLQSFCDARMLVSASDPTDRTSKFYIPSKKIVKNTWQSTSFKIDPQALSRPCEKTEKNPLGICHPGLATSVIAKENERVNEALAKAGVIFGANYSAFTRTKKAYITRPNLDGKNMAFGGWFWPNGSQIQPWDWSFHEAGYEDYSHGCDLVYWQVSVNGVPFSFDEVCLHPKLHVLVSDDGPFNPRFPNAGTNALPVLNNGSKKTLMPPPMSGTSGAKRVSYVTGSDGVAIPDPASNPPGVEGRTDYVQGPDPEPFVMDAGGGASTSTSTKVLMAGGAMLAGAAVAYFLSRPSSSIR
jgi:hypothetical protein